MKTQAIAKFSDDKKTIIVTDYILAKDAEIEAEDFAALMSDDQGTYLLIDPHTVRWDGYSYEQYNKWGWYFRYRQALLQVQYPKRYVELVPFKYEYVPPKDQQIKRLTDKMRAAKAKHTHYMKQIELAKAHWNEIFPIEEHPDYIRAMAKIEQKEALVIELENQIAELT